MPTVEIIITESTGEYGESHGTATLYIDDNPVGDGKIRTQIGNFALCGDGLCVSAGIAPIR